MGSEGFASKVSTLCEAYGQGRLTEADMHSIQQGMLPQDLALQRRAGVVWLGEVLVYMYTIRT